MCGIAGVLGLNAQRDVDLGVLERMAAQLVHRGPDEYSIWASEGIGLAFHRLSIVGIANGRQPLQNEDRSVTAVVNGEFFKHQTERRRLAAAGHQFRTQSDSEILVHLWEDHAENAFVKLRGQFALTLYDAKTKTLVLARDRVGICPLFYAQVGDWLLFASEIKALLASGMLDRKPDFAGLDQMFTFFCMPGQRTAFEGIRSVLPGRYLRVDLQGGGKQIRDCEYWDYDFPNASEPAESRTETEAIDELSAVLSQAVQDRFSAEIPVACLLSGGVDSALVAQLQTANGDLPHEFFTAQVIGRHLDESTRAAEMSARLGVPQHVVRFSPETVAELLPTVVQAADAPVADLTAGCHFALCRAISQQGYKVVVSGEGADEAFGGYAWFKVQQLLRRSSWIDGPARGAMRNAYRLFFRKSRKGDFERIENLLGGLHAQLYLYMLTSRVRWLLLRDGMRETIGTETAYDQLRLNTGRMKNWHPFNQSLYFTYKTHLPGLLLSQRGDRTAMANSVEVRYPFLDEEVIEFCSRLPPQWKLRGVFHDKYLLRKMALRMLPQEIAMRPKAMFRADFGSSILGKKQAFIDQLLSPESLQRTPYFNLKAVQRMVLWLKRGWYPPGVRSVVELSLCTVVATQLWSHLYLEGDLCELPAWKPLAARGIESD